MAVRTKKVVKTTAKPAAKAEKEDTSAADAEAKAAAAAEREEKAAEKREAREALHAEQTAEVVSRYIEGDEKLSVVAASLKITPGKAAFLVMQHRVAEGEVPAIEGKDDESLLKAINVQREKADEYSSWGWLAARSGRSEGFIKNGLEELELYTPKAENIASKRAELKPKPEPKAKGETTTKPAGKKRVSGNA